MDYAIIQSGVPIALSPDRSFIGGDGVLPIMEAAAVRTDPGGGERRGTGGDRYRDGLAGG